ncbi:MAG: hypothetical protein OJF52_003027 [Nitrospira sp.]|jgi:hypothetical protein|nr:MAG: hypothetical protein OJF52_003027 [Nitrospira sp.]
MTGCGRFQRHRVRCMNEPEGGHRATQVYASVQGGDVKRDGITLKGRAQSPLADRLQS